MKIKYLPLSLVAILISSFLLSITQSIAHACSYRGGIKSYEQSSPTIAVGTLVNGTTETIELHVQGYLKGGLRENVITLSNYSRSLIGGGDCTMVRGFGNRLPEGAKVVVFLIKESVEPEDVAKYGAGWIAAGMFGEAIYNISDEPDDNVRFSDYQFGSLEEIVAALSLKEQPLNSTNHPQTDYPSIEETLPSSINFRNIIITTLSIPIILLGAIFGIRRRRVQSL